MKTLICILAFTASVAVIAGLLVLSHAAARLDAARTWLGLGIITSALAVIYVLPRFL